MAKPIPKGQVATVMPTVDLALSGILSKGESDKDIPYVPSITPLQTPSLVWHCVVDSPALDHPMSTQALIDDGS